MDSDQGVSLTDALRSYTRGSAYAGFEEKDKGSLELGKLADMVVLADDPYEIAPEELAGMRTDMTIVGGEIRYRRS
jgi:predicted amidohydrolase YtcJ